MTRREGTLFLISWAALAIVGVAILAFGLIVTVRPGPSDQSFLRAIGATSVGMGLFGLAITVIPYRRRERWPWFALWYYPVFWSAHFRGRLPPGQDQIHQIVFIVLSLIGLLVPVRHFFPRSSVGA